MKKLFATILSCAVGACATLSFDYIDASTGTTIGASYSSKSGLGIRARVEATK